MRGRVDQKKRSVFPMDAICCKNSGKLLNKRADSAIRSLSYMPDVDCDFDHELYKPSPKPMTSFLLEAMSRRID